MIAALRYRDFRLFWIGNSISNVGTWMETLGLGWLVVELAFRQGTPHLAALYLGLVAIGRAIPGLGLSLVAGAIVDRSDRRRVLLLTQIISAVSSLVLAALVFANAITIPALIAIVALRQGAHAFEAPARQSLIPLLVPPRHLMNAVGLTQASLHWPHAVGPAIGGIVIAASGGVAALFLANAASYAALVAALLLIRPALPERPAVHASIARSVAEGLSYVRREPVVRWSMVLATTFAFFAEGYIYLAPAFAANVLGVGATGLSWLMASTGVGSLGGAILVANLGAVRRRGMLLVSVAGLTGIGLVALALQRDLLVALAPAFVVGLGMIATVGITSTIIQTTVPDMLLGRAMSVYSMIFQTCMPLGQLALGAIGAVAGIDAAIVLGGSVTLAASGWIGIRVPALRELSADARPRERPAGATAS